MSKVLYSIYGIELSEESIPQDYHTSKIEYFIDKDGKNLYVYKDFIRAKDMFNHLAYGSPLSHQY